MFLFTWNWETATFQLWKNQLSVYCYFEAAWPADFARDFDTFWPVFDVLITGYLQ